MTTEVPYRENIEMIIADLIGGIRSGLTYGGSKTISELQRKLNYVTISQAGLIEGFPHKLLEKA